MLRFKALLGTEGGQERVIFGLYEEANLLTGWWPIGFYLAVKINGKYRRLVHLPKWARAKR